MVNPRLAEHYDKVNPLAGSYTSDDKEYGYVGYDVDEY